MATLAELLAQKAQLEAQSKAVETQLQEVTKEERRGAIAKIKELMAEHGIEIKDLERASGRLEPGKGPRGPVAAKYRNAATGESWSGRGLQPKWLKAAIAGGASITDFAI